MGVSYAVENESIGGGGIGGGIGLGGGGSMWGLVIFFLFLFSIFSGKKGLFGGDSDGHCGPTNCEVDRDVVDAKYQNEAVTVANTQKVIDNQTAIQAYNLAEKYNDSKMENYFLKGQIADTAKLAPIMAMVESIRCNMPKMRPEYVHSQLASVDNCGRNNGCGNGYDYN